METVLSSRPVAVRTLGLSWPLLVALLALVAVLASTQSKALLSDPDTYWHLATGRWIVEHTAVPKTDSFSHSMPGAAWTAHEWLSELVLVGVHRVAGWAGLVVCAALAFAATLAYLTRFLLARMEPVHALLFTVFAGVMLSSHLVARPHVLTWPLLAVWVGSLVNAGEQGRTPPWWSLALMVLWANLHGSFTLGVVLGGALAIDAVLALPLDRRRAGAVPWALFVALSVAAAMLTPAGWHGLWHTVELMRMTVALDVIGEWLSPDFHRFQPLELWLMLVLGIACSGRVRLPWLRLLLVLGLVHLALKHGRNIAVLGLVSPFLMATPLARQWQATAGSAPDAESIDRVFRALAVRAQPAAIAAVAVLMAMVVSATVASGKFVPLPERTPEAAVQAVQRIGVKGPVLNSYNFGGYLIYQGIPVFMDGRADMYGDALLKRFIEALALKEPADLIRLIDEYGIAWTLLEPGTPAIAVLDRLPGWRRVHSDGVAVAHARDSVVP
jgi:hypothetical protein